MRHRNASQSWFIALLFLFFSYSCGPIPAQAPKDDDPGPARTEGKWTVTPLGRWRDRLYYPFFAEQHRLVIAMGAKPPQLWDTQKGTRVAILDEMKGGMDSCDVSPDGTQLLTADRVEFRLNRDREKMSVRSLWVWQLDTGKSVKKIDIDLSAEEVRFGTDWGVRWLQKDRVLIQLDNRANPARASGRTLLAVLDPSTGRLGPWSRPLPFGESLLFSPNGKRAATGCNSGVWRGQEGGIVWGGIGTTRVVHLVDLEEVKLIATIDDVDASGDATRTIVDHVWSADSRWLATVSSDHTIRIWDAKGRLVSVLRGHTDWILAAHFSADGRTLLTASEDQTARLWEVSTGKERLVLSGHTAGLNDAVFDTAGQVLTTSEDATVRLWDAGTGKQLRVWQHEGPVRSITLAEDGKTFRSRTAGGIERIWSIADGELKTESAPRGDRRFGMIYLKDCKDNGEEVWSGPPGTPDEEARKKVP